VAAITGTRSLFEWALEQEQEGALAGAAR